MKKSKFTEEQIRREGWRDNHKRVHRLYCLEGLNLRTNRKKRIRSGSC